MTGVVGPGKDAQISLVHYFASVDFLLGSEYIEVLVPGL